MNFTEALLKLEQVQGFYAAFADRIAADPQLQDRPLRELCALAAREQVVALAVVQSQLGYGREAGYERV